MLLVLCTVFAHAGSPKEEKIRERIILPPQPVPSEVRVPRSGSAEVELRALASPEPVSRFVVRVEPTHGTLTPLGPGEEGRSTRLLYTHDGSKTPDTDRIVYAVQSRSSGVSASGQILLRIVDPAPKMEAPATLAFPSVFPGKVSQGILTISNSGGGILRGRFSLSHPWSIDGSGEFSVAAGEKVNLPLKFRPTSVANFTGAVTFSNDMHPPVALCAKALAPFAVAPDALEAALIGSGRQVDLPVSNLAPQPLPIEVLAEGCSVSEIGALPVNGSAILQASADIGNALAQTGKILLRAMGHTQEIELRFAPLPARLVFSPEDGLILHPATPDGPASSVLSLKNTGGESVALHMQVPEPFSIESNMPTLRLNPGEETKVNIRVTSGKNPPESARLILSGLPSPIQIPIRLLRPVDATGNSEPAPIFPAASPLRVQAGRTQASTPPSPKSPAVSKLDTVSRTHHSMHLRWTKPIAGSGNFSLEVRQFHLGADGKIQTGWGPWLDAAISENGQYVDFEIPGLQPASTYVVRARQGDKVSEDTVVRTAWPPPPPVRGSTVLIWCMALAALAAGAVSLRGRFSF